MKTVIFVHGVPDTAHVWHRVRDHLRGVEHDAVCLPGVRLSDPHRLRLHQRVLCTVAHRRDRAARPARGFSWGHDWGAFLAFRVVCLRPDLVRSWVCGSVPLDPEYRWHGWARGWQTRVLGELMMMFTPPFALRREMIGGGVPREDADYAVCADRSDHEDDDPRVVSLGGARWRRVVGRHRGSPNNPDSCSGDSPTPTRRQTSDGASPRRRGPGSSGFPAVVTGGRSKSQRRWWSTSMPSGGK